MQWFRMYSEFATDPKVQSMDETLQRRFVMFLCLHCNGEYGKLTEAELAFALRITPAELVNTKDVFKQKGFLGDNGEIRNWNKRQYKSDNVAERVRKHREEKKKRPSNVTATPSETESDTESEKKRTPSGAEGVAGGKRAARAHTAQRLPTVFELTLERQAIARAEAVNPEREHARFCDHWHAASGSNARKHDWDAAWRNWCRKAAEFKPRINGSTEEPKLTWRPGPDD